MVAVVGRGSGVSEGAERPRRRTRRPGTVRELREVDPDQMLRTSEVAVLFDVTDRTILNWVNDGRLPYLATVGGHRRFRAADVIALYDSLRRHP